MLPLTHMPDALASPTITLDNTQTNHLNLANITGLYVELANRVAEHTRVSTEELTQIIASIHQANQAY